MNYRVTGSECDLRHFCEDIEDLGHTVSYVNNQLVDIILEPDSNDILDTARKITNRYAGALFIAWYDPAEDPSKAFFLSYDEGDAEEDVGAVWNAWDWGVDEETEKLFFDPIPE